MKALVLCAGFGTRLGALTAAIPKPMLPIGGEPMLAHTIRHLASQGFTDIAVNTHFEAQQITRHFEGGARFGVRIHYSHEESLLGTAGAVKKLEPFFADAEDFLVLYGDVLTNQDLRALVRHHADKRALVTLVLHQRARSNSLVAMDASGRITAFLERPDDDARARNPLPWVNSGIQMMNRRIFPMIEADRALDIPRDVVVPLLREQPIHGFPLTGHRIAVDSEERYRQAEADLASGKLWKTA